MNVKQAVSLARAAIGRAQHWPAESLRLEETVLAESGLFWSITVSLSGYGMQRRYYTATIAVSAGTVCEIVERHVECA